MRDFGKISLSMQLGRVASAGRLALLHFTTRGDPTDQNHSINDYSSSSLTNIQGVSHSSLTSHPHTAAAVDDDHETLLNVSVIKMHCSITQNIEHHNNDDKLVQHVT